MVFDAIADHYDAEFTRSRLAQWLRGRVWERLDRLFLPGMRVLELGCGTGEDALHLARRGVQVVATDASPAMLNVTQRKAQAVGLALRCSFFDLNDPSSWAVEGAFDGAYSNFGALNCTHHWSLLAGWLAQRIPVGGRLGLGVMGRFCLWETSWHGIHLDWRTATRRWRGRGEAVIGNGRRFAVFYPSANHLIRAFEEGFEMTALRGIGVFLPTSDSFAVVEKRPRLERTLLTLETHLAHRRPFRSWGDHYWLELVRK